MMPTVFFTDDVRLGLDDHDANGYAVHPASLVLAYLQKPTGDVFALGEHKEIVKFLGGLGDSMIEIKAVGIVAGEYSIQPYPLSPEQYKVLCRLGLT